MTESAQDPSSPARIEKGKDSEEGKSAGKKAVPRGVVCLVSSRCKGCGFCIEFCPTKVLEFSDEFNAKGYHFPDAVREDKCINCGMCGLICPEFAIYTVTPEEADRMNDEAKGSER